MNQLLQNQRHQIVWYKFISKHAFILSLLLIAYLIASPANATSKSTGDIIILVDNSISMRRNLHEFKAQQWLTPFLEQLHTSNNLVLARFDEKVHKPLVLSGTYPGRVAKLQQKLNNIQYTGLVTDIEAPLQFLLSYSGNISLALIISDWKPEIWERKNCFLSRSIREDDRYKYLNSEYQDKSKKGASCSKLYEDLSQQFNDQNITFIEESLDKVKNNPAGELVFIDLYGKLHFSRIWAKKALASLRTTPFPIGDIDLVSSPDRMSQETEEEKMAGAYKSDNTEITISETSYTVPPEELSSKPPSPPPPVQQKPAIAITTTQQVLPEQQSIEYKSDPWSIIWAVIISTCIIGYLWFKREKALRKKEEAHQVMIERERQEMLQMARDKVKLVDDLTQLSGRLEEKNSRHAKLLRQETDIILEIDKRKDGLVDEVEAYRLKQIEQVDTEAREEKARLFDELNEEILTKKNEIEKELDGLKRANHNEFTGWLQEESQKRTDQMEQNIAAERKEAQRKFDQWEKDEKSNRTAIIEAELQKVEEASRKKINTWQKDAETRVLSLLENEYSDKVTGYKNDIQTFSDKKSQLSEEVEALINTHERLTTEINDLQAMIDHGLEGAALKGLEAIKVKEEELWQEAVERTNQGRKEAFGRIQKWEELERQRLSNSFQARIS